MQNRVQFCKYAILYWFDICSIIWEYAKGRETFSFSQTLTCLWSADKMLTAVWAVEKPVTLSRAQFSALVHVTFWEPLSRQYNYDTEGVN